MNVTRNRHGRWGTSAFTNNLDLCTRDEEFRPIRGWYVVKANLFSAKKVLL